jgi:hypothetical protein
LKPSRIPTTSQSRFRAARVAAWMTALSPSAQSDPFDARYHEGNPTHPRLSFGSAANDQPQLSRRSVPCRRSASRDCVPDNAVDSTGCALARECHLPGCDETTGLPWAFCPCLRFAGVKIGPGRLSTPTHSWVCEPVHELGAGARPGRVTHFCFEAVNGKRKLISCRPRTGQYSVAVDTSTPVGISVPSTDTAGTGLL